MINSIYLSKKIRFIPLVFGLVFLGLFISSNEDIILLFNATLGIVLTLIALSLKFEYCRFSKEKIILNIGLINSIIVPNEFIKSYKTMMIDDITDGWSRDIVILFEVVKGGLFVDKESYLIRVKKRYDDGSVEQLEYHAPFANLK